MNKYKYKLSIIVPCHNCSKTIERLLDSIINNDFSKEDYEIIIVNDNSTDNFIELVKSYEEKANINYYNTNTEIHCPGNTRQVGLENAKGEWITFIDHDDYFEPNIFQKIFNIIKENNINTVLYTSFYGIYEENDNKEFYTAGNENLPWMHGKFYNHQMLKNANIHFEKDLISHEDVYFNNLMQNYLYINNKQPFIESDFFTYNWVYNPDSTSHYHEGNLHFFDINFKDFVYANSVPFFDIPEEYLNYKQNAILSNFLLFYFDYQLGLYRLGEYLEKNLLAIYQLKKRINKELNFSDDEIIKWVYDNPEFYHNLKQESFKTLSIPFIETQSFKDFVSITLKDKND